MDSNILLTSINTLGSVPSIPGANQVSNPFIISFHCNYITEHVITLMPICCRTLFTRLLTFKIALFGLSLGDKVMMNLIFRCLNLPEKKKVTVLIELN
jgi:hypothetical protein